MAQPLRSSNFGPDYQTLWKQLEERLLEMQKAAGMSCCTEKDRDNLMRWQGIWATFGTAINTMQTIVTEAREGKPKE